MSETTPGTPAESDQVRILRTGEWWTNSWFVDPRVHAALGVTEGRVSAALERIRFLFPAPWYVEEERKLAAREEWHPAFRLLGTGGMMGVGCLLELAETLDAIEGARKGAPGLRTRLLTTGEFSGAIGEGRIARVLRAEGLPYSFEGRVGNDGPIHDLTVHADPLSMPRQVLRVRLHQPHDMEWGSETKQGTGRGRKSVCDDSRRSSAVSLRSSPSRGSHASAGTRDPMSSFVVPMRAFPRRMWLSRKVSGIPGSIDSIQRLTLQSSTASGFMSTP